MHSPDRDCNPGLLLAGADLGLGNTADFLGPVLPLLLLLPAHLSLGLNHALE